MSIFKGRDTKLARFLTKSQQGNYCVLPIDIVGRWQKVPKSGFQSQFSANFNFWNSLFSKMMPTFWWLATMSISENTIMSLESKIKLIFLSLPWKLDNPYCHNSTMASESKHSTVVSDEFCHSCSKPPIKILSQALQSKVLTIWP